MNHNVPGSRFNWTRPLGRSAIYIGLVLWTIVFLFPLYWTVTTSIKPREAVIQGPKYIPWVDFQPNNAGWYPLLYERGTRDAFVRHFQNTLAVSITAAAFAVALGAIAAYGLSRFRYRYGPYDNTQIRNFFLAQLILPPAAVALPILLMFINLELKDTREGLILIYTVMNLPIVIWIMFDQFNAIPTELDQAAQVDGSTEWGAFLRIVLPIAAPGLVAAYILTVVFCWNEYFIALVLASTDAVTLPFMIAGQVTSQGVMWWTMAALTCAAIAPLLVIGILLERYIVKGLTAGSVK
ncbi:MAG: carbohydrate ABC transporter permease [Chloroflexota bacterium]|nr:carbohydrate ABC transporter permease [Chloroflexota bacterium]